MELTHFIGLNNSQDWRIGISVVKCALIVHFYSFILLLNYVLFSLCRFLTVKLLNLFSLSTVISWTFCMSDFQGSFSGGNWRGSGQATPKCVTLVCKLFWVENRQSPKDLGRTFEPPSNCLKEFKIEGLLQEGAIPTDSKVWTKCGRT